MLPALPFILFLVSGQNLEEGEVRSRVAIFLPMAISLWGLQPMHMGITTLCFVDAGGIEYMWRAQKRNAEKEGLSLKVWFHGIHPSIETGMTIHDARCKGTEREKQDVSSSFPTF